MESKVNTRSNMWSREVPMTANGEESESNDHLFYLGDEENKNLCTRKDVSHLTQKKRRKRETEANIEGSCAAHKVPMTPSGRKSERCIQENKNPCMQKYSLHLNSKKSKHKQGKVNTGSSRVSQEKPATTNGVVSGSSNEEHKNLYTHEDSSHVEEECKNEETEVNTGNNRVSYEISATAHGIELGTCNEEDKNLCAQKDSSHLIQIKHEHTESKHMYVARSLQDSLLITQSVHEFVCPTCLKAFNNRSNFVRHLLIHREEKEFSCEVCGKSFTLKQSLRVHMRIHMEEKPFACSECSKSFSDANNLRRHMLIHNKTKKFVCSTCSKAFSLKQHFEDHMLRHEDVKLFACPHCSKFFSQQYRVRLHLNTCKKYNPLICTLCDKHFPRVYNLERHMKIHK